MRYSQAGRMELRVPSFAAGSSLQRTRPMLAMFCGPASSCGCSCSTTTQDTGSKLDAILATNSCCTISLKSHSHVHVLNPSLKPLISL